MAERAKPKGKSKGRKGKQSVPASDRKVSKSDNKPDIDMDEVYDRHIKAITLTQNALKKAQAKNRQAFSAAKLDGCDVEAIKQAQKLHEDDHGDVLIGMSATARCLRLIKSPLYEQFEMFETEGKKINAASDGLMAGRSGRNRTENPFTPGSTEYATWDSSWLDGQKEIAAAMASKEAAASPVN